MTQDASGRIPFPEPGNLGQKPGSGALSAAADFRGGVLAVLEPFSIPNVPEVPDAISRVRFPRDAAGFRECERALAREARVPAFGARITANDIAERPVALGDFLFGTLPGPASENDNVVARAPLPFSGGVAWFEGDGGIARRMECLDRLRGVAQLSLIGHPVGSGLPQRAPTFGHSRFLHTYDVYALGMLCGQNLGIPEKDMRAVRLALLVHDLFTPACGDLMKCVDRKAYDEDDMLTALLSNPGWVRTCRDFGTDPREPVRIAQREDDVLCEIRDFADTLAYVGRDLDMFLGTGTAASESWYGDPADRKMEAELRATAADPRALTVWENLRRGANGRLAVDDPGKLRDFLMTRARLFRLLYLHSQTRNVEDAVGTRLVKVLLEGKKLEFREFFGPSGTDRTIWAKVAAETGFDPSDDHRGSRGETFGFASAAAARAEVEKISASDPSARCIVYRFPSRIKSKTRLWQVEKGGKEMSWGDAFPEEAKEIEDVLALPEKTFVVVLRRAEFPGMKGEYWDALGDRRTEQL